MRNGVGYHGGRKLRIVPTTKAAPQAIKTPANTMFRRCQGCALLHTSVNLGMRQVQGERW